MVLVKKINENELGYRNGLPGKAGVCLNIPRNTSSFFPDISEDSAKTTHIDLNISGANIKYEFKVSTIRKYDLLETKEEYRLYLKHNVKTNEQFRPNDIIILMKQNTYSFYLFHFKPNMNEYQKIIEVLNVFKSGKTQTALVPVESLKEYGLEIQI